MTDKNDDVKVEETAAAEEPKTEEATAEEPVSSESPVEEEAPVAEEPAVEDEPAAAPAGAATPAGTDQQGRQMYDVKCSDCGKATQVPFQPSGDRPVYCRECYMKNKSR
ncbi:MAG: hypothetical protein Q8P25_03875 [Candidatus Curtissbacteria bacterium]|nr:hypothetical protein [Candidatus Curtissbacteria bacterium]